MSAYNASPPNNGRRTYGESPADKHEREQAHDGPSEKAGRAYERGNKSHDGPGEASRAHERDQHQSDGPAKKQAAGKAGGKRNQTKTQREAASSLKPIRTRQSRSQIIATVAADSGIESPIVDRVSRSLSRTLTRHLIRNGSGRVEIPRESH